ncbi:MAG: FAD/NAD(P)-binding oxidoreductase [Solirubrobacteraceae bacterium]|jgi:sulfide:quinone oxidoreductase
MSAGQPLAVVIAGGGVAALEGALALRELAGERVALRLLAPNATFGYRPLSVREPFAYARAERYLVADVAQAVGAELTVDEFAYVDADQHVVHTAGGDELHYDALLLALGARVKEPFAHVATLDDRHMDDVLHGIVQDIEEGYVRSVAFVAPARMGWPLPLYELALMAAARAHDMGVKVELTVVTPEPGPVSLFGSEVSDAVASLLDEAGIGLITGVQAQVPDRGEIVMTPGARTLKASRIIALPELFGPAVRGLPGGEHGFIPVDRDYRVRGVEGVWAAGDAIDFELKFGGLAAQQADAAAASIAALAGAQVPAQEGPPEIHAVLLTGREPRYLSARFTGNRGFAGELTTEPTWDRVAKITARYLNPYLDAATPVAEDG